MNIRINVGNDGSNVSVTLFHHEVMKVQFKGDPVSWLPTLVDLVYKLGRQDGLAYSNNKKKESKEGV